MEKLMICSNFESCPDEGKSCEQLYPHICGEDCSNYTDCGLDGRECHCVPVDDDDNVEE